MLFFGALPLTILAGSICPENGVLGFDDSGNAYCYLYERFSAKFLVGKYSILFESVEDDVDILAERNCRQSYGQLASVGNLLVNDFVARK